MESLTLPSAPEKPKRGRPRGRPKIHDTRISWKQHYKNVTIKISTWEEYHRLQKLLGFKTSDGFICSLLTEVKRLISRDQQETASKPVSSLLESTTSSYSCCKDSKDLQDGSHSTPTEHAEPTDIEEQFAVDRLANSSCSKQATESADKSSQQNEKENTQEQKLPDITSQSDESVGENFLSRCDDISPESQMKMTLYSKEHKIRVKFMKEEHKLRIRCTKMELEVLKLKKEKLQMNRNILRGTQNSAYLSVPTSQQNEKKNIQEQKLPEMISQSEESLDENFFSECDHNFIRPESQKKMTLFFMEHKMRVKFMKEEHQLCIRCTEMEIEVLKLKKEKLQLNRKILEGTQKPSSLNVLTSPTPILNSTMLSSSNIPMLNSLNAPRIINPAQNVQNSPILNSPRVSVLNTSTLPRIINPGQLHFSSTPGQIVILLPDSGPSEPQLEFCAVRNNKL